MRPYLLGCTAVVAVLTLLGSAAAQEDDFDWSLVEEAASLDVTEPIRLGTLRYVLATFGVVPYGDKIIGELYRPTQMCQPEHDVQGYCVTGCSSFEWAHPPLDLNFSTPKVFLLDETVYSQTTCSRVQRAVNAAAAGASAVIIIAADGEMMTATVNPETDSVLDYTRIHVPVGVVSQVDANALLDLVKLQADRVDPTPIQVQLDFTQTLDKQDFSTVQIWHSTADDCRAKCPFTRAFLEDIAPVAQGLADASPILIQPHYFFETCDDPALQDCERNCVNNNRYCYHAMPDETAGSVVVMENVRQLCLWEILEPPNLERSPHRPTFWDYKLQFQQRCRSAAGLFSADCSMEVFLATQQESLLVPWEACVGEGGSTDAPILAVDDELRRWSSEKPGLAVVDRYADPMILVNDDDYRGHVNRAAVVQAACEHLTTTVAVPECNGPASDGFCVPGSPGDLTCRSAENAADFRSKCLQTAGGQDFKCVCEDGFVEDLGVCKDVNECTQWPDICGPLSERSVCFNAPGTYACEEAVPDKCASHMDTGCWHGENAAGDVITSCRDTLEPYRAAAASGTAMPQLFECDCAAVPGCYVQADDAGTCGKACPDSLCNTVRSPVGTCTIPIYGLDATPEKKKSHAGMIAAATIVGLLALASLVFGAMHRRQIVHSVKAHLQRYHRFDDSESDTASGKSSDPSPTGPRKLSSAAQREYESIFTTTNGVSLRSGEGRGSFAIGQAPEPETLMSTRLITPARERLAARIHDFENFTRVAIATDAVLPENEELEDEAYSEDQALVQR